MHNTIIEKGKIRKEKKKSYDPPPWLLANPVDLFHLYQKSPNSAYNGLNM